MCGDVRELGATCDPKALGFVTGHHSSGALAYCAISCSCPPAPSVGTLTILDPCEMVHVPVQYVLIKSQDIFLRTLLALNMYHIDTLAFFEHNHVYTAYLPKPSPP